MKIKILSSFLLTLFASVTAFSQTYLVQVKPATGKVWGYANEKGEVVIKPQFEKCWEFNSSGLAVIYDGSVKQFYAINTKGEKLNTEIKDFKVIEGFFGADLKGFQDGMLAVKKGDKWGFLNSEGKLAIPLKYDNVNDFNGGYAPAASGSKYVIVNKKGEETPLETAVGELKDFSEGLAPFRTNDKKFGYMSEAGKVAIPAQFESVGYFKQGIAWAKTSDKKVGYINTKGEWIIKPVYEAGKDFDQESGLARVKGKDKWSYVTKSGEAVELKDTEIFEDFSEGLAKGRKNGKFGFLNSKGEWVIKPELDGARSFVNGYSAAKKGDNWGMIDKSGKWVIEPIYDGIKDFAQVK